MAKTPEKQLLKDVQEELTVFLDSGKINEKELTRSLSFEELDIEDFERLKEIHFILSDLVTDFMDELPEWIRRIKTESYREKEISRGEIKGRIDWGETYKTRFSQNYKDKSLFVTQNPDIEYNIPENLVLKKVLGIIYRVVTKEIEEIDNDWREKFWKEEDIEQLRRIFQKNVNVDRIKDMEGVELNSKQLNAARNSRREVYRRAYDLYQKHEKIMENEFTDKEIQKLLENTLVIPNKKPRLFELFSIFKVIKNLEEAENLKLQVIGHKTDDNGEEIAVMENEDEKVLVYHDSTGNLDFKQDVPEKREKENEFVTKTREIITHHEDALEEFIEKGANQGLFAGVPDIVIEKYDISEEEEKLKQVVIGEVKYTDRDSTFSTGLRELLEYMKFGEANDKDIEDLDLKGLIIADSIDFECDNYPEMSIQALNYDKLVEEDFEITPTNK